MQALAAAGADVIAVQELQSHHRGDGGSADGAGGVGDVGRQHRHPGVLAGQQVHAAGAGSGEGVRGGADRARRRGRSSIGPKWIQWVQLQDNSTKAVFIAATHHLVPSYRDQRPHRTGTDRERVAYAKKQILAAGELAHRLGRSGQIPFLIGSPTGTSTPAKTPASARGLPVYGAAQFGLYSNWRVLGYPKDGTQTAGTG